jgi:hypothetical protein
MANSILAIIFLILLPLYYPSNLVSRKQSALIILTLVISFATLFLVSRLSFNMLDDDVSNAISHSAFWGPSKKSEFAVFLSMTLTFCITCFVGFKLAKNAQIVAGHHTPILDKNLMFFYQKKHYTKFLIFTIIINVAYIVFYSDINVVPIYLNQEAIHPIDFDSQNIILWQYLFFKNFIPYKDFWFPYAEQIRIMLPTFQGHILSISHKIIILNILNILFFRLFNFNFLKVSALYLVWVMFNLFGYISWTERYYGSIVIYLLFIFGSIAGVSKYRSFFIGLGLAYFSIVEPMQMMSAVPPIILSLLLLNKFKIKYFKGESFKIFFVTVFFIMAYCLILYLKGSLGGYYDFISTIHQTSQYASFPIKFNEVIFKNSLDWLILALIFINLFLLIYLYTFRNYKNYKFILLMGMNLLTLILYQKNIVRPSIANQIFAIPLVTFMYGYISFLHNYWKSVYLKKFTYSFFIFVITLVFSQILFKENFAKIMASNISNRIAYLNINFIDLFNDNLNEDFNNRYFSNISFINSQKSYKILIERFGEKLNQCNSRCLFVLGDEPFIYLAFGKIPPYFVSLFNQSFVSNQVDTIKYLASEKPKYLIINRNFKEFDIVPNLIRSPLIYKYVINNYRFVANESNYDLLEYSGKFESSSMNYWRHLLGSELNYGSLYKSNTYNKPANEVGAHHYNLLRISKNSLDKRCVSLTVSFLDLNTNDKFRLYAKTEPLKADLSIPLNNLWFWGLSKYQIKVECDHENITYSLQDFQSHKPLLF